ncbi:transposase IS4 family protein [Magnetospirillum fulvum MGU-K5]|uniref:Transposase IS4 family protein n=1 Tax=Magnetospirillum fulvum MGU-K5 TaxID=1316936 RepID=S9SBT4_MAGFU|nr:transposase IS4 family protein [Magnetospirillum fulvum MGU-K5]
MENRSGLIVDTILTRVSGHAERLAALDMIEPLADRLRDITLGGDRGYDAADFVEELRTLNVRPRVAQNINRRRSAIDRRTTRPVLPSRGERVQAGGDGGSSTSLIRRWRRPFFCTLVTVIGPTSAVERTWVPPQGWRSIPPIRTTRSPSAEAGGGAASTVRTRGTPTS